MANICLPQNVTKLALAAFFMLGAVGLVISGFTVLPIVGFVFAVPFALISFYFFRVHLNDQCEIESQ